MQKRHTVSIKHDLYTDLHTYGRFGESFNDLLARILDFYESGHGHKHLTLDNNGGLHKT